MKSYLRKAAIYVHPLLARIYYVLPLFLIGLSANPVYPGSEAMGTDLTTSHYVDHSIAGNSPGSGTESDIDVVDGEIETFTVSPSVVVVFSLGYR